ncbi:MAG: toxin-antitoxin system protein [Proteobacteria bacterium]|nr:toxin-antitoxin system protein [Pseudomonadota bacterium]
MASVTVRISAKSRQALRELALQTGDSMQSVLEKAIDVYRRQAFFEQLNASVHRLQEEHPDRWQQELEERRLWESTLADGLENDPYETE